MEAPTLRERPGLTSPMTANSLTEAIAREAARLSNEATLTVLHRPDSSNAAEAALQEPKSLIDTRVRITAASAVELPGFARIEAMTTTGPVLSGDEDSVTVSGTGGQTITLPRPGHKIVGVIVGVDERMVTVARDRGPVVTVPRTAIARLERSNARHSRKRSAGLGFLIGAGGGAGVGFLIGSSCKHTGFLSCFLQPWASTFGGVVLGGGAGALFGAFATPAERWMTVPADWLAGP
jgi:hypothetical protein